MKVKLKDLLPNPYRAELGPLNDRQVHSIVESCQMSCFGVDHQFDVRKASGGKYEMVHGHHTYAALVMAYGLEHEVNIAIKDYTDRQMFQEMCRENLTKHNDALTDKRIIIAAKKWLERFPNELATSRQGKRTDLGENHVSAEQVQSFLSRNRYTVSIETVRKHLLIETKLAPDLKAKVAEDALPFKTAEKLCGFDHEEQRDLVKALNSSPELRVTDQGKVLRRYNDASAGQKEAVRKGQVDIAAVGMVADETMSKKDKARGLTLDDVLNDISKDLNHATILLTDSLVDNIQHASPDKRERFEIMLGSFLNRLKEIRHRLGLQPVDQEVAREAVVL